VDVRKVAAVLPSCANDGRRETPQIATTATAVPDTGGS